MPFGQAGRVSVLALERHYAQLIEDARRARAWATKRDEALARGDRAEAERCLLRYWWAVRRARGHLVGAWPGLELFARRELAAYRSNADADGVEGVLAEVRRRLSVAPPAVRGVPGLYGHVRRLARDVSRTACRSAGGESRETPAGSTDTTPSVLS